MSQCGNENENEKKSPKVAINVLVAQFIVEKYNAKLAIDQNVYEQIYNLEKMIFNKGQKLLGERAVAAMLKENNEMKQMSRHFHQQQENVGPEGSQPYESEDKYHI